MHSCAHSGRALAHMNTGRRAWSGALAAAFHGLLALAFGLFFCVMLRLPALAPFLELVQPDLVFGVAVHCIASRSSPSAFKSSAGWRS